jgi:hypothetical protein
MEIPHYWNEELFNSFECDSVEQETSGKFVVRGSLSNQNANGTIKFIACNPADYRQSYSGSGLPFPNPEIAYQNTLNKGSAPVVNGRFEFRIDFPNSLYVNQGTTLLPPHVLIRLCDGSDDVEIVQLGESIPHRTLSSNTFTRSSFKDKVYPLHDNVNPNYYN